MKRFLIAIVLLAFILPSCRSGKDTNIHVDHAKEKNKFRKSSKKYRSPQAEW